MSAQDHILRLNAALTNCMIHSTDNACHLVTKVRIDDLNQLLGDLHAYEKTWEAMGFTGLPSLPQGKDQGASLAESAAVGSLPALPDSQSPDGWRDDLENAPMDVPLWGYRLDNGRSWPYGIRALVTRDCSDGRDGWFLWEDGDEIEAPVLWMLAAMPDKPRARQ